MRKFAQNAAFLLLLLTLLSACAPSQTTKKVAFPDVYGERPLSILVLPPMNITTAAEAKEYYSTTVAEPLSYAGYYVLPVEVTTDILKREGMYDTEMLTQIAPHKFKQYFGADAVLYTTITKWDTAYFVIGGHVTVGLELMLKSTTTEKELWRYACTVTKNTGGNSGGGVGGLIANLVITAIKTAKTDYLPLARAANARTIYTLPYGKYHPNFNNDGEYRIIPGRVDWQYN